MFIIRQGRMALGAEIAQEPGYLINRTGSTTLAYEPLMCDVANTSYDLDADDGGVLGNGIIPVADGTWSTNYLVAPVGIVQQAGVANAARVPVMWNGRTPVRISMGAATGRGHMALALPSNRHLQIVVGARTLALRFLGWTMASHGGTGVETLADCSFSGLSNTA